MKTRTLLPLILLAVTLLLSAAAVSAQDIDVDSMSNEQLIQLLQAIMQKLNADEPETGVDRTAQAPQYQIWENKKLMIERLPDWYFVRAPKADEDDDGSPETPGKKKTKTPSECENYCAYEVCDWANVECYWDCYYPCIGEPYPQWHIDAKNP